MKYKTIVYDYVASKEIVDQQNIGWSVFNIWNNNSEGKIYITFVST